MAKYTPRVISKKRGRNFNDFEKSVMESLWESGELRGVGECYSPIIQRTADSLGRTADEIKVSELVCIIFVNLL